MLPLSLSRVFLLAMCAPTLDLHSSAFSNDFRNTQCDLTVPITKLGHDLMRVQQLDGSKRMSGCPNTEVAALCHMESIPEWPLLSFVNLSSSLGLSVQTSVVFIEILRVSYHAIPAVVDASMDTCPFIVHVMSAICISTRLDCLISIMIDQ